MHYALCIAVIVGISHMSPVATVMEALKLKHEQNIEVIHYIPCPVPCPV